MPRTFSKTCLVPPPPKPPPGTVPIPPQLPKIIFPTAAPVCQECKRAASQVLTAQQTPAQYLEALHEDQMRDESVKFLAYGLPERESVWSAVRCAQKVFDPVNVAGCVAIKVAWAWVMNPAALNQKAAAGATARFRL